jgi:hypothetical protein
VAGRFAEIHVKGGKRGKGKNGDGKIAQAGIGRSSKKRISACFTREERVDLGKMGWMIVRKIAMNIDGTPPTPAGEELR